MKKGLIYLNRGVSAVLIAHLRQLGGVAEVNCAELGRKHGFGNTSVHSQMTHLENAGLLTVTRNGPRRHPKIALNEEAIRKYEASGNVTNRHPQIKEGRGVTRKSQSVVESQALRYVNLLRNQARSEKAMQIVGNLIAYAERLLALYRDTEKRALEAKCRNAKLEEAAKGLDASASDLSKAKEVGGEELAEKINLDAFPEPAQTVDFTELLEESAKIFKPLAGLQQSCKILRGLVVELQREETVQEIIRGKLDELIRECQEVVVDVSADFADWKKRSDAVVENSVEAARAVVSSKI